MSDERFEAACNQAAVQINGKSFGSLTSLEQTKLKKQVRFILAAADSYNPVRNAEPKKATAVDALKLVSELRESVDQMERSSLKATQAARRGSVAIFIVVLATMIIGLSLWFSVQSQATVWTVGAGIILASALTLWIISSRGRLAKDTATVQKNTARIYTEL